MNKIINECYKILIITMIIISILFFLKPSMSEAGKIKLKEGQYYYSGTQESELVIEDSFFQRLLNALSEILDYVLGMMTLGVRGVVIGWIEIMEIILTAILSPEENFVDVFTNAIVAMDNYSQEVVTIENIIFNKVEVLNANIFK